MIKKILTDFSGVVQQRTKIDNLLKKDKNFYIQQFFQDVMQRLNMVKEVVDQLFK